MRHTRPTLSIILKASGTSCSVLLVGLLAGCDLSPGNPFESLRSQFRVTPLESVFNIDDAGVGDLNGDGRHDLWTTNHSALQWVALATPERGFQPGGIDVLGLHQDSRIPGIEAGPEEPNCRRPGARLFVEGAQVVVKQDGAPGQESFSGELYMPWPSSLKPEGDAEWSELACPPQLPCTHGRFRVGSESEIRVDTIPARSDGFPISVMVDPGVALKQVHLGHQCIAATQNRVEFALKDRHGLLLADLSGDSRADLFISRGGARGRLNEVHPGALDELWVWDSAIYREAIGRSGITKGGCPGRQVGALDIDGDGDLDIYQVCGRGAGANSASPNRLYIQTDRGRFEERAEAWGLALEGAGTFAWVPEMEPGKPPRLVWANAKSTDVFQFDGNRYRKVWASNTPGGAEDPLLVGDLTGTGEFSLARVSRQGSVMLDLMASPFKQMPFSEIGLPDGSIEGDLVDVDGDRNMEMFLIPQGLFTRREGGLWQPADALHLAKNEGLSEARSNWFDADQDGDLDLWLTLKDAQLAPRPLRWPAKLIGGTAESHYRAGAQKAFGPLTWQMHMWQSVLVENLSEKPSHVALDVIGASGNSEALGTVVTAIAGDNVVLSRVGQAEGSRLSQTLHTVYLGISGIEKFDHVTAAFPDGTRVRMEQVDAHTPIVLRHPAADPGVRVLRGSRH